MASIIKVDQIQTAAGGTPTAADLGINTTGSVLNVQTHTWGNETVNSTTTYADVSGSSFVYTPVSSNSTLIITGNIHCRTRDSNRDAGFGLRLVLDGNLLTGDDNSGLDFYADSGNGDYCNFYTWCTRQYFYTNTSTTGKTIKAQQRKYDGIDTRVNISGSVNSNITVIEIAG